jgi:tyrosine-specific transport protein
MARSSSPPPTSPRTPRGAALPSLEDLRPADASVVSAVALVLGSTIGAGILALPAVGSPAGFGPSATVLAVVCAALTAEALLIAEVNLAVADARRAASGRAAGLRAPASTDDDSADEEEDIVTLRDMAAATLGPRGGAFVSTAYLSLSYALLVAYIAKAGDLVAAGLGGLGGGGAGVGDAAAGVDPGAGAIAFVAATGAVLFAGTGTVDIVNRWMTAGLLVLYAGIVAAGATGGRADWGSLVTTADWGAAPASIPVVLLALVSHDLVPVVCAQLRGDRRAVRASLLLGSVCPLLMFWTWDAVALALASGAGGAGAGAGTDPLQVVMAMGGPAMHAGIAGFSLLAIATSCLGTSLGLSQTVIAELRATAREWLAGEEEGEEEEQGEVRQVGPLRRLVTALGSARLDGEDEPQLEDGGGGRTSARAAAAPAPTGDLPGLRALAFTLVLGPPLAAALANPGSFFTVLNAVGGYGMTALYGVLPPLMAWRLRSQQQRAAASAVAVPTPAPLLPGGRPVLASLCAGAAGIEVSRLADDLGAWSTAVVGPGQAATPAALLGAALADAAAADGGGGPLAFVAGTLARLGGGL